MTRLERSTRNRTDEAGEAATPPAPAGEASLTARARELYRASDDAIEQALSGDSALFLASSRQLSGQ